MAAKRSQEENLSWCQAFARAFWSSLVGGNIEQNKPTAKDPAASNSSKKKSAATVPANNSSTNVSGGLINTISQTAISQTGHDSHVSTTHRRSSGYSIIEEEKTEIQAPLASDDFNQTNPLSDTNETCGVVTVSK